MRNITVSSVTTVEPGWVVSRACPPTAVGVNGLLPVPPVPTVAVVDVPQWASPRLRPSAEQQSVFGRIAAEGFGYAFDGSAFDGSDLPAGVRGAERRPAAAPRTTSTARNARTTQNKQLHLMSRRDPCSWRPPV